MPDYRLTQNADRVQSLLNAMGQNASGLVHTPVALPADFPTNNLAGDFCYLLADFVGTGTAANPQFPEGWYQTSTDGGAFALSIATPNATSAVAQARWGEPATTNITVSASDLVGGIYKKPFDTSAGPLEVLVDAGLPVGSEFEFFTSGENTLTVRSTDPETINGAPASEGLVITGSGLVIVTKVGTNLLRTVTLTGVQPGTPAQTSVGAGEYYFSKVSAIWQNTTAAAISLPADETAANMQAAGLTQGVFL